MDSVVITGIGALTPMGLTFAQSWQGFVSGAPSTGKLTGFDPLSIMPPKDARRYDPFIQFAYAAALMAIEDASLKQSDLNSASIVMGSSRGGIGSIEQAMITRPAASLMAGTTVSMAASYIAMRMGLRGSALGLSHACASGAASLGEAMRMVRYGMCAIALAGGAEAPVTPFCQRAYGASGVLSNTDTVRPFDRKRDGFVLSEGAAVLVLEEKSHALARGARIIAELAGYGNCIHATHPTAPSMEGEAQAMRLAMKDAGISPQGIGAVFAHGTATTLGDSSEASALEEVFGQSPPVVTALKSHTGHMLAASGAFEAAVAAHALSTGTLPPTANVSQVDFPFELCTSARPLSATHALLNSFGFGGANISLVIARA